jgi:ferredoxin-NADP reductase
MKNMIAQFNTKLISKEEIAKNTFKFIFEKPHDFDFIAGQYVFLNFTNPKNTDDRPSMRAMSIASAPQEDFLMFVMRGSDSAFKKNIIDMNSGDMIQVKGPIGHTALPDNIHQPIVFLISGVGITAARSMIRHEEIIDAPRPIVLFYSNRTKDSIALKDELDKIDLEKYQIIHTLTREGGEWDGEEGRIDRNMIEKYIDDIHDHVYYVVGAGVFIESMKELLKEMGVNDLNVYFDNFG